MFGSRDLQTHMRWRKAKREDVRLVKRWAKGVDGLSMSPIERWAFRYARQLTGSPRLSRFANAHALA